MRRSAGPLLAVLCATAVACSGGGEGGPASTSTTTTAPPTTVPYASGTVVELTAHRGAVGECFDRRPRQAADGTEDPADVVVLVVPCERPHTFEVFATWVPETEPGTPVPERELLESDARNACVAQLEGWVGVRYELSVLEVDAIVPSDADWLAGERGSSCVAYHREGELLVGSQAGAGV